jgi:hypothetical protein
MCIKGKDRSDSFSCNCLYVGLQRNGYSIELSELIVMNRLEVAFSRPYSTARGVNWFLTLLIHYHMLIEIKRDHKERYDSSLLVSTGVP